MNKLKTIIVITILLCGFVLVLTILDIAALHDINKDYLRSYILEYLKLNTSNDLPDWTATKGEWQLVTFSLFSRFIYLTLNYILLNYLYRKIIPLIKSRNIRY